MTSTSEAKRAVQETIEQLGGIDIVIANAVSIFVQCMGVYIWKCC
jgi:NAD(P)-dependent dehydrogenase (short-subunit alcohol dehydrogenase family)